MKGLKPFCGLRRGFGEDFYLELQDTGIPEQDHVNEILSQWGEKHGVECVATTDCHYLTPHDAEAHEVLQCIEHGKNLDVDRPKSLVPSEYYLKPAEVMRERFVRFPKACDNTLKIADKCNLEFKFKDEKGRPIYHLPKFRPDHIDKDAEFDVVAFFEKKLRRVYLRGFKKLPLPIKSIRPDWEEMRKKYETRLEDELVMIARTGFSSYFLIVADFINWAKRNKIPVGPGRGSGAGSLVAYSLKSTISIRFNLIFCLSDLLIPNVLACRTLT